MTESVDDNITTVNKIVYMINQNDQVLVSDIDNDDDLHVCRKCNAIFKNLSEYLEHKVKYENYRISQTFSKWDHNMVLPQLVQKKKSEEKDNARNNVAENFKKSEDTNSSKLTSVVHAVCELPLDKSSWKEINVELEQENLIQVKTAKKRGRKRKSVVSEVHSSRSDLEMLYMCTVCQKKFRRKATLRWHMNYEHKVDKKNRKDNKRDAPLGIGKIIKVEMEKEENSTSHFEEHEDNTLRKLHVTIQQHNMDKLETTDLQDGDDTSLFCRKPNEEKHNAKELDCPYVCKICGRQFKKMTALKTHGAVHSDERKYVCTVNNCPYGFKLKGGLVRHMRRHTGERPYICENCGRSFTESGALTRHMKTRQSCARRPGSAYPRYMKNWTHHPNIPAVIDPSQRDLCHGRNKVFKNLLDFQECKVENEDYNSCQTHPIVESLQKQKRRNTNERVDNTRRRGTNVSVPKLDDIKSLKQTSVVDVIYELPSGKSSRREGGITEMKTENVIQGQATNKSDRMTKSEMLQTSKLQSTYICTVCEKKFRREATLSRHMKYEHKNDRENGEDSDNGALGDTSLTENDTNVRMEKRENGDHHFEEDEHQTIERVHVVIQQYNGEKLETTEDIQDRNVSSEPSKNLVIKAGVGKDRPYMCDICGKRFKKMTALKTHGAVHSDERKYVCAVKNCPYGFKLKGGLVRHMRRHTGERPYVCDNCGRAFSESGALTRHMKSQRNCARTPDSAYHRYLTNWTYHPNIPAVIDPVQRSISPGQSAIQHPEWNLNIGTIPATTDIITVEGTEVLCETIKPLEFMLTQHVDAATTIAQQSINKYTVHTCTDISSQEQTDVDSSHFADVIDFSSSKEVEFLNLMQCYVCKRDFGTVEDLEIHLRSHLADQPARCGFCHFLSHDQEELQHHNLSMHYDSLKNVEACVLSVEEGKGRTKIEVTQDKKNTRRDALTAVKQLYYLKKQKPSKELEKERSDNERLQCIVCNRFFGLRSYLLQHMRTHTGDRPHQCHVCHRSFTSRDILKKHMFVHKDQRDFKCAECGKLFKRLTYVQQHLKIHNQERTIQCSMCDKLFRTQYSLTVHMRTHSGVNPYKCHVCSRHFRERGSLRRHVRLHAGEKPYKCHLCNRAFAENGTLSRHLKAKVPCTIKQSKNGVIQLGHSQTSNMLTQFSTVVANTQNYIQNVDSSQQFMLPSVHEGQVTETLHIFESDMSDSVIIVTEKSIVDLIRDKQISFEQGDTDC